MTTTDQPIDIAPAYLAIVRDILDEHVPDCEVRAFGSRATWVAKDYSDLDLAIVSDQPIKWRVLSELKDAFEESYLPFRVDVLDWHDISDNFREIIRGDCTVIKTGNQLSEHILNEWPTKHFGDCAKLVRESISPSSVGNVPYIGLEHIGEGTLSLVNQGVASDVTSTKSFFKQGDILFGKLRPYFRKVTQAPFDGICSTDIWVVRAKDGIDQRFLFYCMASKAFVDFATNGSEGTRMPRAKWEYVSRYKLPVPTLYEQQKISRILGSLDEKIELNRRMNETLEAMAQALFKSWFVDFDPVRTKMEGRWRPSESLPGFPAHLYDHFPDCLVASELGEIPQDWEIKELGDLCHKPQYGYTASANETQIGPKLLRITDINKSAWIDWSLVPYCKISDENVAKYQLHRGDIVIARIADPGHGCMIEENILAVFASYLIRFRPVYMHYSRFLQYWLRSDMYWKVVMQRIAGTTRSNLNAKALGQFPLVVPPISILNIFAAEIDNIRSQILANVNDSRVLANQRDILSPRLLSRDSRIDKAIRQVETVV